MDLYEEKLKSFIKGNFIHAEHFSFNQSCHSVEEAAKAANADADEFVKNICMINQKGDLVVAIVKGEDRVSILRVGAILGVDKPRMATPEEILQKTGYPCGGTPSFGYDAIFLIDERVMEKEMVYAGGGSESSLIRISTMELQKTNHGRIVKIRK